MVRKSARSRKVVSYKSDAYNDLDSDDESPVAHVDSDDEDFQAADADGDGDPVGSNPESSDLEDSEDEGEADSDDDYVYGGDSGRTRKPKRDPKAPRTMPGPRPPGSAPAVHKKHVRTVTNGATGRGRRKNRLRAEGVAPNVIRAPDPSVRITYRPGFQKATGKMDRIVQIYGAEEETVEKALWVKEMYISSPAVPERACLHVNPFLPEEKVKVGMKGDDAQRIEVLGLEEAEEYMGTDGEPLRAVVGPVGKYQRAIFQRFGVFPLKKYAPKKKGYMFNIGGQPLSMEWATNRPDGDQFLAISLLNQVDIAKERDPDPSEGPLAFTRRSSKSTIQVWRFPVPDHESPSPVSEPSVVMMICHEWGPAKTMKWCPAPMEFEDPKVLGYLAVVLGDGIVRVLRVALPDSYDAESLLITNPLYVHSLPDEILTTVSWISSTALVAGSANGVIACWSLTPSDPDPIPYHTTSIHHSYITGLTTCFPSFPYHIITSSMDGYSRITSLISSEQDTVPNNRSRIAPACIAYVDAIQSGVSVEEGTWVKFFPTRRYFSSTTTCKHNGVVRSVASSPLHTSLLSGGTEGEALFSNPARRVFHGKIKNYAQTWFRVEAQTEGGLMRITEGFALEECEEKAKINDGQQLLTTVFPPQICVDAVCWNPNLRYGGWATAALSCGLVRVEDVALD